MKKIFLQIILIFNSTFLIAQSKIDKGIFVGKLFSDTTTLGSDEKYLSKITPILNSTNKIEVRFFTCVSFEFEKYTILTFNNTWTAKHYYYNNKSDSVIERDINEKVNIDLVFEKLVSKNIFSLPDQKNLNIRDYTYYPTTNRYLSNITSTVDGTRYYVEFKVGGYYRRYSYSNPEYYTDQISTNCDLRNFIDIVEIFKICESK